MWAGRGSGQRLEIKVRPQRSLFVQALLIVWRWRVEVAAVLLLAAAYGWLSGWLAEQIAAGSTFGRAFASVFGRVFDQPATSGAVVLMLLVPAVVLAWGPSRRYSVRHAWCTITRHRLRLHFAEADIANRSGRLPWIVHVRPTPVGERAFVWMAPGLSIQALEDRATAIASTCWARDARITATRRVVTLVRVDVVRRDPLETTKRTRPIPNRIVALAGRLGRADSNTAPIRPGDLGGPSAPANGKPAPAAPAAPAAAAATAPTAAPTAPAGPAVIVNGEDVSDYV